MFQYRTLFVLALSAVSLSSASYTCSPANAISGDNLPGDARTTAAGGVTALLPTLRIKRAEPTPDLLRRQAFTCPDDFDCWLYKGNLLCLNLASGEFIWQSGTCGNVNTGVAHPCAGSNGGGAASSAIASSKATATTQGTTLNQATAATKSTASNQATGTSAGSQPTGSAATPTTAKQNNGAAVYHRLGLTKLLGALAVLHPWLL